MWHLLASIWHTAAQNQDPNFCPPEVKPRPMKTIYIYQRNSVDSLVWGSLTLWGRKRWDARGGAISEVATR